MRWYGGARGLLALWLIPALGGCGSGKIAAPEALKASADDGSGADDGEQDPGDGGQGGDEPRDTPLPSAVCEVPALADTAGARVVGSGTPESCSEAALDAALAEASAIRFDCGAAPHTLVLTREKRVTRDLVIDGEGRVTLSGGGQVRAFSVIGSFQAGDPSLTLQRLRIVDTRAGDSGCAVLRRGEGTLTLLDVHVEDAHCSDAGPDIGGGAVYSQGGRTRVAGSSFRGCSGSNGGALGNLASELVLVNTLFEGNQASGSGGGGEVGGQGGLGGAVYVDGTDGSDLSVCGSVFRDNRAGLYGGAMFRYTHPGVSDRTLIDRSSFERNEVSAAEAQGGALYHQGAPLVITASAFVSNRSARHGGALAYHAPGRAELTNVTLAANSAGELGLGGAISAASDGVLRNCTLADNEAFFSGAVHALAQVELIDSLVVNNRNREPYNNGGCAVQLAGSGANLQFPGSRPNGSSESPTCAANVELVDPGLLPLGDHGGPTPSMALAEGSPAIGRGSSCPPTDQRGEPRQGRCDLGAVQF